MLETRFFPAALFCAAVIGLNGLLRADDPSPTRPEPGIPAPAAHQSQSVVRVTWSEAEHAGAIEIEQQKFAQPDQITDVVRSRLKSDPATRFVVLYKRAVPLILLRRTAIALHDGGATAVDFFCEDITLPVAKDARQAEPPANQTIVTVHWATAEKAGSVEIDRQIFTNAEQIIEPLRVKVKADPATRILIRADRDVAYPFLKEVMIAAGKAGAGKVTFSVVDDNPPVPIK